MHTPKSDKLEGRETVAAAVAAAVFYNWAALPDYIWSAPKMSQRVNQCLVLFLHFVVSFQFYACLESLP